MRTTKRFSPTVLARFLKQGRGTGTSESYIPWHRVGRSDPSSMGRSHLQMYKNRQREVLSDKEWVGLFFCTNLPYLHDLVEQFPLSLEDKAHESTEYRIPDAQTIFPGTLELAKRLGIKHPLTNEKGASCEWVMTTDILLVFKKLPSGDIELLAVAFKTDEDFSKKRTKQLLSLEREYWVSRNVEWLLITPNLYDKQVALRLRDSMPWALENAVSGSDIETASGIVPDLQGRSLTYVLEVLAAKFGTGTLAKRVFWQAVWSGKIPLDLRRGWRPHEPIRLLSSDEFMSLNPIASRRSAWI